MALFEIDTPADEQEPDSPGWSGWSYIRVHRSGRSVQGDASPLLEALADVAQPTGLGHVYVAAEAGVVRSIQRDLAEERGLRQDQVSPKAYWRRGLPNAEHGEPTRRTEVNSSEAYPLPWNLLESGVGRQPGATNPHLPGRFDRRRIRSTSWTVGGRVAAKVRVNRHLHLTRGSREPQHG